MATVDVIVPCYNYGRYLRECVGSALSQEGVDVRVLIIDDCSTDDGAAVGRALAVEDVRVEFRRHETNRGHIATYNEGIDWLSSAYCMLLSADDVLCPGALARAAAVMDAHPEVGLTHGRCIRTDRPAAGQHLVTDPGVSIQTGAEFVRSICETATNVIETPSVVGRTTVQKTAGYYRAELPHAGEMELWFRYAARSSVAALQAHQAFYRTHANNMSHGYRGARDLAQVELAFASFFAGDGSGLRGAAELRATASRQVVERIHQEAYYALECGEDRACRELLRLAADLNPRTWFAPKWMRLRFKRLIGFRLRRALRAGRAWVGRRPRRPDSRTATV
ncbi:MAG: glycosyl transferase family protein [Gemmataceae bacterium]|nr:glycosyl transferase family protein [Gemmataceae bacterium]